MSASAIPDIVKKNVRAVLLSKIGGVVAAQFLKDYKHLVQEKLNYVEYGFPDIESFIKAIPEYARFEYSQKEMAYKIFGVGDPNTYMSMAAKKAQGIAVYSDSKRNGMQETDDAKKLVPNGHGLYTLCFKIELIDSTDKNFLMKKFSDVGEIGEVNVTARWVFIRYKTKNGALAALQRYSSDYDMHIADEKNTSASHSKVPRSGDNECFNCKRPGHMVSECPLPWTSDCYKCKKTGHKASDCPELGKKSRENGSTMLCKVKKKSKWAKGKSQLNPSRTLSKSKGRKSPDISVFIGNISCTKTENEFKKLLEPFNYKLVKIVAKEEKVYAFVLVATETDARALIAGLHDVRFGSRLLQVHLSENQRQARQPQDKGYSHSLASYATPSWTSVMSSQSKTSADTYETSDSFSFGSPTFSQHSSESDLSFSNLNICVTADGNKVISSSPQRRNRIGVYVRDQRQFAECVPDLEDLQEEIPELEDIEDDYLEEEEDEDGDPVSIFVGNFPCGTTERELTSLFWVYGVQDVNMVNDGRYNQKCTKAYVWLQSAEEAQKAIADLNQRNYLGCVLLVDVPRSDPVPWGRLDSKWSDSDRQLDKHSVTSSISEAEEVEAFTFEMKRESFSHFLDKMKAWKNTLEPGMNIQVYVTTLEKNNIFWGQNISETEDMKKLHDLTVELQKPSSRLSRTKGLGRCAARFDNEWYRAWVIRVFNSQNKVHVFYLDYGNTSIVNVVDSQLVPSMFWNLAPRCRPFKIIGSRPENLQNLESEVINCRVISTASSEKSFLTEIMIIDK